MYEKSHEAILLGKQEFVGTIQKLQLSHRNWTHLASWTLKGLSNESEGGK